MSPAIQSRDEIVVDWSRLAIAIGGDTFVFQPTSFRLIAHLIDNYGRWVRAETIRAAVLLSAVQPGASNVRWHVLQARLALGDFRKALHSDRSLGVMFQLTSCDRRHCGLSASETLARPGRDGGDQFSNGISSPGLAK
jgi:DNA-binding response OmpR family regulator